ncbi:hypothetical protein PIPA1_37720 [Pelosinus sp. IPA-1]|nr:hypothetical protein PIPA1_37720 [Pelosinus sp. IPA-1]
MFDLGQQLGAFFLYWAFWFIILYLSAYFFSGKVGKTLGTRKRIFLIGKVSLLCTAANVVVNVVSSLYRTI